MKKYLIVLAAAAIALAGCKGGGSKYTSISFKESTRTLTIGEQVKFSVMWEPTTIEEAPLCTWASSDTTVLKVDENGNVSAEGLGTANITATHEELTAVCKVTVESYEESWSPSSTIYYFPSYKSEQPISDSVYIRKGGSGAEYECQMYTVKILILNDLEFDGGIGEGNCISTDISALFITGAPEEKKSLIGEIWDLGLNIVNDEETFKKEEMSGYPGVIDPAIIGPAWQTVLEDIVAGEDPDVEKFSEAYKKGVSGTGIINAECTASSASMSYIFAGIVNKGYVKLNYDASIEDYVVDYKLYLQWCYGYVPNLGHTGLAVNYEAEEWADVLVQPYKLGLSNVYYYETGKKGQEIVSNNAPKKAPRFSNNLSAPRTIAQPIQKLKICSDRPKPVVANK